LNPVKNGVGVMSTNSSSNSLDWPPLPFSEWENTLDTVHMWSQIVGKARMAREPLINHWWNVTLYVTPVGLTTTSIPYRDRSFEVELSVIVSSSSNRSLV